MFNTKKILAVVPARGGSKGILRKNLYPLNGEPLIGHTLKVAKRCEVIDCLVVSTDDDEIASTSLSYGVDVIHRPSEYAQDTSLTEDALLHVVEKFRGRGQCFDVLLVLEPTSPLRSAKTINKAVEMIVSEGWPSVIAVKETKENFGKLVNGGFVPFVKDAPRRRQDRQPLYKETSTIYAISVEVFQEKRSLVSEQWGGLVVEENEAVDVNSLLDLNLLEVLIEKSKEKI